MDFAVAVTKHLAGALKSTGLQVLILFGPGLALAAAMQLVSSGVNRLGAGILGMPFYYLTFPGTVIHELSHAAMCLLFRHRVTEMKLFAPDRHSGTLGYVNHRFDPSSPYQVIGNFFIGLAPIIAGSLVIYFAATVLVTPSFFPAGGGTAGGAGDFSSMKAASAPVLGAAEASMEMLKGFLEPENLKDWRFYLFIYILLSVGGNLRLSVPDMRGAWSGFALFCILLFVFNAIALFFGGMPVGLFHRLAGGYSFFYVVMGAALLVNSALLVPLFLIRVVKKK